MAIAFDTATDGGHTTGASLTFAHTCTGSNLFLVVGIFYVAGANDISSVTYNGVAMTQAIKGPAESGGRFTYIYFLANPSSGANNVVITPSASGNDLFGVSASYTGAIQSSSVADSTNSNSSGSGNASVAVTTVADNCWVTGVWRNSGTSSTAGSGTTVRKTIAATSDSVGICDSNTNVSPPAAYTLNVNGTAPWGMSGASFAPFVAVSATRSNLLMMGV